MNTRFRDRIALGSAIAMGLGVSTGHPLGIIAAAAMPLACLAPGTRKAAFKSALGYYIAALWPMVPGLDRYIGQSATISDPYCDVGPDGNPALGSLDDCVRHPIAFSACGERRSRSSRPSYLRSGLSDLLRRSPRRVTFFREPAWAGLAAVALMPGILLSTQRLGLPPTLRCSVSSLSALCVGLAIGGRLFRPGDAAPPRGWIAVNTHFGDVSQPFRDFVAAQFIQQKAAESSARVLIFPEAVVPRWSEATEAFWRQIARSLPNARPNTRHRCGATGARPNRKDNLQKLSDLKSYDFSAAIDALKRMDTTPPHAVQGKPRPEPIDNTMLVVGAESATFYQRVPVPVGMWQPFSRISVPLRLNAPGVLAIDHQRAAVLICYEQMLTFPILASMLQHPTVIVGISNTFWVDGTTIPRYQATALRGWARLFRLPYFLAVNS